jgi:tyrosine-specific transport protein
VNPSSNPVADTNLKRGSVLGAALLVAGSCIGAGMLALPIKAGTAGFLPFLLYFLIAWFYMTSSGLVLLEVNLSFKKEVSFISMATQTLGRFGKYVAVITFCFLFYSLITAFITGISSLIIEVFVSYFNKSIPFSFVSLLVTLFFTLVVFIGVKVVDHINRLMMLGLVVAYILLLILGFPHVNTNLLTTRDWGVAFFALPVMIIMFGFQNLIPTLSNYLRKEPKRLVSSILIGSIFSFIICVCWGSLILGIVPLDEIKNAHGSGSLATQALQNVVGLGWVSTTAQIFSFFAIVTSCLGVALSFVDFLSDGFKSKKTALHSLFISFAVMLPPYFFTLTSPRVFFIALDMAGGFAAVVLFGLLPACMAWKVRKELGWKRPGDFVVFGGKGLLIFILLMSGGIFILELLQELGI